MDDLEDAGDLLGHLKMVVVFVLKIDDLAAGHTMHVMMVTDIGIETLGSAKHFHDVYQADRGKGQKSAVDRIERDVRKFFLNCPEHQICRGVPVRLNEGPVDGHPLRRNLELMPATGRSETFNMLVDR